MHDASLPDMFDRMISNLFDGPAIRSIEEGSAKSGIWETLEVSGFLDALVPEAEGGAGLSFAETMPLFLAMGRRAVPLPIGETMIARAVLAKSGRTCPSGPIVLGLPSLVLPGAQHAEYILTEKRGELELSCIKDANYADANNYAGPHEIITGKERSGVEEAAEPLSTAGAVLFAALIVGASDTVLQMSVDYALHRVQFGKSIAQQQALQQNLAVAAEHVVAARMACETASSQDHWPSQIAAAWSKIVASRTASVLVRTAHAVHGAIGISSEHELNIYTKRIQTWRLAGGTETYWAVIMGRDMIADPRPTLPLMLQEMFS
ncbi:acyl-CoA dehydrogenase [Sphingomonas sp. ID1715]|uniref:acyl-CoA dehydrogenase family protein n=1 Tax=Sphingomonas sp. ID1715 TaxID=1656898 RepID=UPI00148761EB|nr:acyl-CoA dehydrogenase family protein [Sphingomonas sp. ID1715]NNM78070.1 acyl-CoA dehydrogenase [Sphingomonas sp. ID1715]